MQRGNYNVFVARLNSSNMEEINRYAYGVLNFTLGEIIESFEEIKTYHFNTIFMNHLTNIRIMKKF